MREEMSGWDSPPPESVPKPLDSSSSAGDGIQRRSKKERRRPRTAGGEGMRGKEGGRSRSKSPKRPKTSTGIRQTASALNIGEGDGKATSKWISPYNARQLRSLDRRSTSEIIRSLKSAPHVGTYGRLHMGESLIEPDERQIFEPFRVTVLVVSGSVDTQRRLHEVLNAGGYCTRVANGIASALAVLQTMVAMQLYAIKLSPTETH